ncbi:MAG: menaquinone biosynthesis protein [Syntrophotaleaceae bacterium]
MSLRIGHIDYLNCVPFFHYLNTERSDDCIIKGTPARLNTLLANGQLDVCPSSSFEYGRNWQDYLLLPDLSISACGAVNSVLLFSHRPLTELGRVPIALTGESSTSVHLLQILLREYCDFADLDLHRPASSVEDMIAAGATGLLIGDRALKAVQSQLAPYVFDLGSLWQAFTGLPFVFALWIVRRDAVEKRGEEVACLQRRLRVGLDRALADLPTLADKTAGRSWIRAAELLAYWRAMSFVLDDAHLQGLMLFFRLAVKYHFLEEMPELNFFGRPFPLTPQG